MGGLRGHFLLLGAVTTAAAIALFLGAAERGAANTVGPTCAGKPVCVTITDQDNATPTTDSTTRYLTDSVTVSNGTPASPSTSNLVNLTLSVSWSDSGAASPSVYQSGFSSPECTLASTPANTITCTTPKSLGPGQSFTYSLVFQTASLQSVASPPPVTTTLTATAAAKEQAPPKKTGGTNVAVVSESNTTPYEVNGDLDISAAGGETGTSAGIDVTLATSSAGSQSSSLHVPADSPRGVYVLSEEAKEDCTALGFTCFGQHVTTVAVGLEPVNLRITFTGLLPSGANAGNITVLHDGVPISDTCSGALFSGTPDPSSQIPCRRVAITHLSGGIDFVQIDAWDVQNGGWGVGAPR